MTAVYDVTVTLRQRVSPGRGRPRGYATDAHAHVPGAVLRGALAAAALVEGADPAADRDSFRSLFDGDVRYGPLLPEGCAVEPLSLSRCKYPVSPSCGARDEAFVVARGGPPELHCPGCGQRREMAKGAIRGGSLRAMRSTSIDRGKGTAKEGNLFRREAIEQGTVLTGRIAGPASALVGTHHVRLGGRTSILGEAEVVVSPAEVDPFLVAADPGAAVVLRLRSPAVVVDDAGRAVPRLEYGLRRAGLLGDVLHPPWERVVLEGTGGWHAASGLPKPADHAVAAGSTVVLRLVEGDPEVLRELLARGLGLRRAEGFGWLEVADPAEATRAPEAARQESPRPAGVSLDDVAARVDGLGLDASQRRWLVQRLKDPLDRGVVDRVLRQPGRGFVTAEVRSQLRDILNVLAGTDVQLRTALAERLRDTGRRGS